MWVKSNYYSALAHLVLLAVIEAKASSVSPNITTALSNLHVCGFVKATDRLYGSRSAEIGEFPWIVAIEYRNPSTGQLNGIKCIGSLINNRYILTAAHCMAQSNTEPFRVWLGDWKISTDPDCRTFPHVFCENPVKKIEIESKIVHTNFNKGTGEHDIALLRLKQEVEYDDFIQPICLATKDFSNSDPLIVVSWGMTTPDGNVADTLQSVILPRVPIAECENILKKNLSATIICAGGEKGKDTCRGDGGAPLVKVTQVYVKKHNEYDLRWFQDGITSWGAGCGRDGYPGVYTNVVKHIDWIIKHVLHK